MIENIMCFVISVQIFLVSNHILDVAISIQGFKKYIPLISLGVAAFFFLIIYVMKLGKGVLFLLSVFIGLGLYYVNYLSGVLIYLSFYLYILGLMKDRKVLTPKIAGVLSPVILLGLIPVRVKGVFQSRIAMKLHSLLYSTGKPASSSHPGSSVIFNTGGAGSIETGRRVAGELIRTSNGFKWFIILAALLILLAIFLMFLAKFYLSSKNKKMFYASMFVGIAAFLGVVVVSSALFFEIVRLYRIVVMEMKIQNGSTGSVSTGGVQSGLKIIKQVLGNGKFVSGTANLLRYSGVILGVIAVVLGFFFLFFFWKFLFGEQEVVGPFGREEKRKFEKKIRSVGIERALSEISDPSEYVRFLYFSSLYLLKSKGFSIEKFETPEEFRDRLFAEIEKPIPYFSKLTEFFNIVKYGKSGELGKSLEEVKSEIPQSEILSAIRGLSPRQRKSGKIPKAKET